MRHTDTDTYTKFEIFVLRSIIILLAFAVGARAGHSAVDLIEEIRRDLR